MRSRRAIVKRFVQLDECGGNVPLNLVHADPAPLANGFVRHAVALGSEEYIASMLRHPSESKLQPRGDFAFAQFPAHHAASGANPSR